MKRLVTLTVLLFLSVVCFAETITFKAITDTVPEELQGRWTETAVSQDKGKLWIDGISKQIKITESTIILETIDLNVVEVISYTNESGMSGYLVKVSEFPDFFEFWFKDDNNVMLLIHSDRVESLRCRLRR